MALGPTDLRQPDVEDLENIRALESRIDNSREFMHFRYGTVLDSGEMERVVVVIQPDENGRMFRGVFE